jgi:glycosidase
LKEAGVSATWLSPIFKSPMVGELFETADRKQLLLTMLSMCCLDFGYDISDYQTIQPEYGTMEDFEELIAKAKELGMSWIFYLLHLLLKFSFFHHTRRYKNHSRLCAKSLKVNLHCISFIN